MSPKRILIVSGAALSRNPRVLKEAETLAAAGHAVTVLTLRNHATAEAFDLEIMVQARFRRIVLDVATAPGASAAGVFLRRLKTARARWAARQLGLESIETIGPAGELLALARKQPADLVIGHTEVGLWVVAQLLAEGRTVAADIEDWHSEDLLPADRAGRPVKLLGELERTLLQHAAFTTTTSEALASALQAARGGRRPRVVSNSFALQTDPRQGAPGQPPAFLWFSQTLGRGRGLEDFLAAWSQMSVPSRVVLVGEDRTHYRETLRALVPAPRRTCIKFSDLVSPRTLPSFIARHDVGLALETTSNRNHDLTISNKILQYLNAGIAVVATSTAGQREVLERSPEAGVLLEASPTLNAKMLDRLIGNAARLQAHQRAARRLAETHYSWENESRVFLTLVNQALADGRGSTTTTPHGARSGKMARTKQWLRRLAITLCDAVLGRLCPRLSIRDGPLLVIAPHQDDESLGCGGLIARMRAAGRPVQVVFITDGAGSHPRHPTVSTTTLQSIRRDEAMAALGCLGVAREDIHFLNEPDGSLQKINPGRREQLVQRLASVLTAIEPREIFLPCNPDGSSEHDATFGFVAEAIARTGRDPVIWQYPIWAWWNPHLIMRHWLKSPDTRRLPPEEFSLQKSRAIACYRSQIAPLPPDVTPALPPGMVEVFQTQPEYFFRHKPSRLHRP